MLYGPGVSGKSTILQMIYACLTGFCGVLPDGSLVGRAKSMSGEITDVIAGCRMVLCYDVDLEKDQLNMSISNDNKPNKQHTCSIHKRQT